MAVDITAHAAKFKGVLGNRLIILPEERRDREVGGIIIPERAQKRSLIGTVILTGPGLMTPDGAYLPMQVKAGDIVVFNKFTAYDITEGGVDYLVVQEDDILATAESLDDVMQLVAGLQ